MKLFESIQKNNYKLSIDSDLGYGHKKIETIKRFISFCYDELSLEKHCDINLVSDREAHNIKTTAYWLEQKSLACIYAKNRMLVDVMRSLAHELVHKKQYEEGRIKLPVQDIGGEIEDEANALAGAIIKKFTKETPSEFQLIENLIK